MIRSYFDNNGNGKYDPGIDDLISEAPLYNGTNGTNGSNGADGKSSTAPTIEVGEKTAEGETAITITNADGTIKKATVKDGEKGDKGDSVTANIVKTAEGVHTITIQDKDGTTKATVKDGKDGKNAVAEVAKRGFKPTFIKNH